MAVSLLSSFNMTSISYGAGAKNVDNIYPQYFLRSVPSDTFQIIGIMSVLNRLKWDLVIPIFADDSYGVSAQSIFSDLLDVYNISVTCAGIIPYYDSPISLRVANDKTREISKCIATSSANVVILFSKSHHIHLSI